MAVHAGHSGEVGDDHWADYLTQTVFENVLGSDIPDLFPVRSPGLLRFVYLQVATRPTRSPSASTSTTSPTPAF